MEFHKHYHYRNPCVFSFENGITRHHRITTFRELILLLTHVQIGQQLESPKHASPSFN